MFAECVESIHRTSHAAAMAVHTRTVIAHAAAETAHARPFEPTAIAYEKWRIYFYSKGCTSSIPYRLFKYFPVLSG